MNLASLIFPILLLLGGASCQVSKKNPGTLHITSKLPGEFEVFQVKSENPPQVVAEKIGNYNQDISLNPGKYIILADCSSQTLTISENQIETLTVGLVELELPPTKFEQNFPLIQCERSSLLGLKQKLLNRKSLHILPSVQSILIGPAAFTFNLIDIASQPSLGQKIQLGAIVVGSSKDEGSFFVSGMNSAVPLSQSQDFGKPIFLLPGEYMVEVNGTKKLFSIAPLETKEQAVGYFVVKTPQNSDAILRTERPEKMFATTKSGAIFELDKVHIGLPGSLSLKIGNTLYFQDITIVEHQVATYQLSGVTAQINCIPPEIICQKKQRVFLFQDESPYYFTQGFTNEIIYHWFSEPLRISLNTSESLYKQIHGGNSIVSESIGKLELHFKKKETTPKDLETSFLRIYPQSANFIGQSFDISPSGTAHLNLFAAKYRLLHFLMRKNHKNYDPVIQNSYFTILPGRTTHLIVEVY